MRQRTWHLAVPLLAALALLVGCAAPAPASPPASAAPPPAQASAPTPAPAPAASATAGGAAAPAALTKVRMGTQTSVNDIAMWLAAERGYFLQEGIDIELVPFASASEMVPALATDQLEAGGIAVNPATLNAIARGVPIKIVLDRATFRPGFATQAMMVRRQLYDAGRGRTLGEMKGFTVAILPPGKATGSGCALEKGMQQFGASINDLNLQPLSAPDMLGAFVNGQVDAGLLQEPFLTEVLRQGTGVKIMGQDEMFPNMTLGVTAFSTRLYDDRPAAKGVVRAYIRAARAWNDAVAGRTPDRPEMDALIARYTRIDIATVREMTPTGVSPNGIFNLESQLECLRYYIAEGLVPNPPTEAQLNAAWGLELVEEVLNEIGRVPE
ncbi:MAG: ABC transporter substrate-binding protein [Chloroflexi bacterium]|nr:ABC transporter substrate-binding protein [Chloroflexota bacterium]